ncbi:MAG: dihydrofolate reductase family protein [Candidatus Uhrbacteria bacterium]|nr:dihydrofolate reductase family protein [Candidatus Uhrbacteria bacterium]
MKVELIAAISVDGKIAESKDQLADWTSKEDKRFFVAKTKEAGVLVMGRTTYETIGRPLPDRLNIVMTRDTSGLEGREGELEYTSASPSEILDDLKVRGFETVVIAGGAQIYSLWLREGLITDLYLTVEPVLFGSGVSLVDNVPAQRLELVSSEPIGSQAVLLHYRVLSVSEGL